MAKSIRSKIKKRLRTAKRARVYQVIEKPRHERSHAMLKQVQAGEALESENADPRKNSFRFGPRDDEVEAGAAPGDFETPQSSVKTPIDFRATSMPTAGR